jgi:hypothetical protein
MGGLTCEHARGRSDVILPSICTVHTSSVHVSDNGLHGQLEASTKNKI